MNYLAHAFLSHHKPDLLVGNILADIIKQKEFTDYSLGVQEGIIMHRKIDSFTDQHPVVRNCTKLLQSRHGKYSPVVMDLLWDLVLAEQWDTRTDIDFNEFVETTYQVLLSRKEEYPKHILDKLEFLIGKDFLTMYSHLEGMQTILDRIQSRTKFKSNFSAALEDYTNHKETFFEAFNIFFPELQIVLNKWTA